VREVFALTRREGIETLGYFMIGHPTETKAEIDETIALMLSLPMDYAHIAVFTPYPGTAIYQDALADGIYDVDYWRAFARNPSPDFLPRYGNENFTGPMLMEIVKSAYSKFYGRPSYMVQRLRKVRSAGDFFRKATLGFKLLSEVAFKK